MNGGLSISILHKRPVFPFGLDMDQLSQEFSLPNGVAFPMSGMFDDVDRREKVLNN